MYDIFYIGNKNSEWEKIKTKFPLSKRVLSFQEANSKSFTKMFWCVWDDHIVLDSFNFDYQVPIWDQQYIHVFKNSDFFDGICLFPKNITVSTRELEYRFFVNKKEVDIVASVPKPFDRFEISTYADYLEAVKKSSTDMFWACFSDIEILEEFKFKFQVPKYEQQIVHVFKNGKYFDGVCLFPKHTVVSKNEFNYRFFTNKKEVDIVASTPKPYDRFTIDTYEDYLLAIEASTTDMFWVLWPNTEIIDESVFDLVFSRHNSYDRNENHVWKNLCNDEESYISGLTLFSKSKLVSKREIEYRMLVDRKEHDQTATRFRYPRYQIDTYEDYLKIYNTEKQPLFWAIWPEVEIIDEAVFDFYYDPLDGSFNYDRNENHVFQNVDIDEIKYNGLMLLSTNKNSVSKKEIDFRYIIDKKEHGTIASKLKLYDIVFISYNETNADENFNSLKSRFPRIKRVHGVKGIHNAHIEAAKISETPMFWVVDADAQIVDDFNFDLLLPLHDRDIVHVWKSQNPINDLIYGYGGVKLFPKKLMLNSDITTIDMTTSVSDRLKVMNTVSNITAFNTDPFNTWKSAFRECAKLASGAIKGCDFDESYERLEVWCSKGADALYGEYAIAGAIQGRDYGYEFSNDREKLNKINDFAWLEEQFKNEFEARS